MTSEQKRIMALESTIQDLLNAMEEARMGFGSRYANRIRQKLNQDRQAYKFSSNTKTAPKPATPAAPEEVTPA